MSTRRRPPRAIDLHIQELVLDGFPSGDQYTIREAMERELGRLLSTLGLPSPDASIRTLDAIDAGSFRLPPGSRPSVVGQEIGLTVYRALVGKMGEPFGSGPNGA